MLAVLPLCVGFMQPHARPSAAVTAASSASIKMQANVPSRWRSNSKPPDVSQAAQQAQAYLGNRAPPPPLYSPPSTYQPPAYQSQRSSPPAPYQPPAYQSQRSSPPAPYQPPYQSRTSPGYQTQGYQSPGSGYQAPPGSVYNPMTPTPRLRMPPFQPPLPTIRPWSRPPPPYLAPRPVAGVDPLRDATMRHQRRYSPGTPPPGYQYSPTVQSSPSSRMSAPSGAPMPYIPPRSNAGVDPVRNAMQRRQRRNDPNDGRRY